MLRFILRNRRRDNHNGMEVEEFFTRLVDVPEIEHLLRSGGYGESGYDHTSLVGVAIELAEAEEK